MAKAPIKAPIKATTAAQDTKGLAPVDRLIMAMAAVIEDRDTAPRIRHLFLSQANGNLQISLDMHQPVEG